MSEDVTIKFADFLLRHQHYLHRVENGTIQAMEAPYKKAKAEIYNKLIKLQESPLQPGGIPAVREWRLARLNAQLAEIDNVLGVARADSVGALQAVLPEVANVENMAYTKMLATQFEKIGIDIVGLPYDQINFILEHPLIYQYRGLSIPEASFFNDQKFVSTIRRDLTQSIIQGEDMARAVRRLGVNPEVAGLTGLMGKELKGYLTMVARSEIQHVSNSVNRGIYAANQDVLKGVIFAATLDNRTCVQCASLDTQYYGFTAKGGDHKGPQLPLHVHCRCCYIPVTKTWKELGSKIPEHITGKSKAPFMGNVLPRQSYEQWLLKQTDEFQKDVLGPARYKLWKKGEFPLKKMATTKKVLTVDELEKKVGDLLKISEVPIETGLTPIQKEVIETVRKTAQDIMDGNIKEIALSHKIKEKDLKVITKRFETELKDGTLKLQMNRNFRDPDRASYKDVLENGRFKNQFELGKKATSGGANSPKVGGMRDGWERNIFQEGYQKD